MKKQKYYDLILYAMKFTVVQMVLAITFMCAIYANNSSGQDVMDKTISIKAENAEITKILSLIKTKSGVKFVYSSKAIKADRKISVDVVNKKLRDFIIEFIKPLGISFAMVDNKVLLYAEDQKVSSTNQLPVQMELLAFPIQEKLVSGKVIDEKGNPLEGATVALKSNSGVATRTDALGNFKIEISEVSSVLLITYVGFKAAEVKVRSGEFITVTLTELVSSLNDVVVIGYGTRKRKDLTGAISQVKATQLENENPKSIQDMLRGNAPGLDVGFDASTKGQGSSLQIRGKGTLTAASDPLIVLDGIIYPGSLSDINPNDIATIDILKDASSASVFGARSANGVVLISTKKGKGGKPTITVNSNLGINRMVNTPHLLNAEEFIDFRADALWSINGFDSTSKPGIQYKWTNPAKLPTSISTAQWLALDPASANRTDVENVWLDRLLLKPVEQANYKAGKFLDWEKLIYNNKARQHDHTVSVAQRKEDYNYYFSLGYMTNEGVTVGDVYKTIRARFNLESNITKFLTVGINSQYSNRDESSIPLFLTDVQQSTPWGSLYQADGITLRPSPNDDPGNNTNPFIAQVYNNRMYKYDNFFASVYAKGNLPYGFSYQVNFSPRIDFLREYNFRSPLDPTALARKGVANRRNQTVYSWQLDNIIRWNKKYGNHSIEATFLVNAEKFQSWNTNIQAENFAPNGNLGFNALQSGTLPPIVSSDDQYSTGDALMGRVAYNYNQRYFFTATTRRDGYSAFGQLNPRATFPSMAVAWAITEERFMKRVENWLDYGKIRLSYGENGNREIGRYAALSSLGSGSYVFVTTGGVTYNNTFVAATNLANAKLKWERNSAINLGFDFSVLKGKVGGSVDFYNRTTKDLLVNRSLPPVSGFGSVLTNLGEVENKGYEITLNTENMQLANFSWKTSIGFWVNRNKIKHLYGPTPDYDPTGKPTGSSEKDDINNNWFIGHSISSIYDYPIQGVWQMAEATLARSYGFQPGDMRLVDGNGDGKITIADKRFIGESTPKYSWNMRNEFKIYKNFDFSFTLYARIGQLNQFNEVANANSFYDRSNFFQLPYWTPSNQINDYGKIASSRGGGVSWNNYKKASFVRLSNISLAYTIPKMITQKWKIESLKFYTNVFNAAVFSNWNYWDPENRWSPTPSTINFGLNLTL